MSVDKPEKQPEECAGKIPLKWLVMPKGVVAVFAAPDGREIANTSDFNPGAPGGFEQQEAQRIRARRSLAFVVMRELAAPMLSKAIGEYEAERILEKMCDNGCHVFYVPVGYDEEKA